MYFYLLMNKDFIIIIIIRNAGFWHSGWLFALLEMPSITAKFEGTLWVASPLNPMFFLLTPPLKPYFF